MVSNYHGLVVGVFEDPHQAQDALEALHQAGFRLDQLGIAIREDGLKEGVYLPGKHITRGSTTTGAIAGGAIGGVLGAALATVLLPAIGPIILGGVLAGIGAGAVVGIKATGFLPVALSLGIPEEEARHYEQELDTGRSLVLVKTTDRSAEAADILRRHGALEANIAGQELPRPVM